MKLTLIKALEFSILKWKWIVKYWDYTKSKANNYKLLLNSRPELKKLRARCGLCEMNHSSLCLNCVLELNNQGCYRSTSHYYLWIDEIHKTSKRKKAARGLLSLLKKLLKEEVNK